MAHQKTKLRMTRTEAADKLSALAQQLRLGALKSEHGGDVYVSDDVEMKTKTDHDELEIKIEWENA